jgi:hypothetical protein
MELIISKYTLAEFGNSFATLFFAVFPDDFP